jgi:hypothetical protein
MTYVIPERAKKCQTVYLGYNHGLHATRAWDAAGPL